MLVKKLYQEGEEQHSVLEKVFKRRWRIDGAGGLRKNKHTFPHWRMVVTVSCSWSELTDPVTCRKNPCHRGFTLPQDIHKKPAGATIEGFTSKTFKNWCFQSSYTQSDWATLQRRMGKSSCNNFFNMWNKASLLSLHSPSQPLHKIPTKYSEPSGSKVTRWEKAQGVLNTSAGHCNKPN